jgi:small Trp-rich protein
MAMWFLVVGVLLLLMKWFEFGPIGHWPWWIVLAPFGLALAWFEVIEPYFGLDKKKAHDDIEKVKEERIKKAVGTRQIRKR